MEGSVGLCGRAAEVCGEGCPAPWAALRARFPWARRCLDKHSGTGDCRDRCPRGGDRRRYERAGAFSVTVRKTVSQENSPYVISWH